MLVEMPIPTAKEALASLETFRRYLEHQNSTTPDEIRSIRRFQGSVEANMRSQMQQSTLESWIR
jgi:hypothetical protein